ncbi:unnamed protein product [Calypogeia fissa]
MGGENPSKTAKFGLIRCNGSRGTELCDNPLQQPIAPFVFGRRTRPTCVPRGPTPSCFLSFPFLFCSGPKDDDDKRESDRAKPAIIPCGVVTFLRIRDDRTRRSPLLGSATSAAPSCAWWTGARGPVDPLKVEVLYRVT